MQCQMGLFGIIHKLWWDRIVSLCLNKIKIVSSQFKYEYAISFISTFSLWPTGQYFNEIFLFSLAVYYKCYICLLTSPAQSIFIQLYDYWWPSALVPGHH